MPPGSNTPCQVLNQELDLPCAAISFHSGLDHLYQSFFYFLPTLFALLSWANSEMASPLPIKLLTLLIFTHFSSLESPYLVSFEFIRRKPDCSSSGFWSLGSSPSNSSFGLSFPSLCFLRNQPNAVYPISLTLFHEKTMLQCEGERTVTTADSGISKKAERVSPILGTCPVRV